MPDYPAIDTRTLDDYHAELAVANAEEVEAWLRVDSAESELNAARRAHGEALAKARRASEAAIRYRGYFDGWNAALQSVSDGQ